MFVNPLFVLLLLSEYTFSHAIIPSPLTTLHHSHNTRVVAVQSTIRLYGVYCTTTDTWGWLMYCSHYHSLLLGCRMPTSLSPVNPVVSTLYTLPLFLLPACEPVKHSPLSHYKQILNCCVSYSISCLLGLPPTVALHSLVFLRISLSILPSCPNASTQLLPSSASDKVSPAEH